MKIERYAQSTFVIENQAGKRLLIDPGTPDYAGCRNIDDFGRADVIVLTHNHKDHFDVDATKELVKRHGSTILANPEIYNILQDATVSSKVAYIGDSFDLEGFGITCVKADHNPGGTWIINFGVVVETDGKRVYHPSDTRLIQLANLPGEKVLSPDVLLVPISNRGLVMGIDDALFFTNALKPKTVVPIHYESAHDIGRVLPEHFVDRLHILKEHLKDLARVQVKIMAYGEKLTVE
ncbi:MBL fold metallo-hydrolase [Nitrospinota bacterium]